MKLEVVNIEGQNTGKTLTLDKNLFGINPNEHVVYLAIKHFLANQRKGTHAAKARAQVTGSTKKLRRQKGNGAARIGSVKSPLLRGGGTVFGPIPRDYNFKLNKKTKSLASKSILSSRAQEKAIKIIEDFSFEKPKTKEFLKIVDNLKLTSKKILFVLENQNKAVYLSSRNVKNANIVAADACNVYDLANADEVIISEKSIEILKNRLK